MGHQIRPEIAHLAVPISRLHPHPKNPNNGDIEAIKESLQAHGQYAAVVYNTRKGAASEGCLVKGNHTYFAALELGWTEMAATTVDVDDEQAIAIMVEDNRASDLHRTDEGLLASLLSDLPSLDGTLYSQEDLDDLLARVAAASAPALQGDPDDVPPLPDGEPVSKRGELWKLGRHRLLCGDSTNLVDVERLLGGRPIDMVWTDPPYGVAYVGKTPDALTIENDALGEQALEALLREAFSDAHSLSRDGAAWYVCAPAGPVHVMFGTVLRDLGILRQTIIWVKNSFVLGHGDYHYRHETLYYGWKEGGRHYFVDDRTQDSVWEIDRPSTSPDHPTTKPVELVARALRNSSKPGQLVYDPFAGSGTTLVAAEQEGRTAYLMEVDCRYADVCVARYEALTGAKAERHEGVPTGD